MNNILSSVIGIAEDSGQALLNIQKQVREIKKPMKDFLTDADIRSHDIICAKLGQITPEIPIYSEEGEDKEIKSRMWVIDPLDGTINFFHQDVFWGVTIALVEDGTVKTAVINLPALKWLIGVIRKDEIIAKGITFGVRKDSKLSEAQVWTDWAKINEELTIRAFLNLAKTTRRTQIRMCSSAAYLAVAAGHIAGFVHPHAPIEDMAAGALIVEMAGGKSTDISGNSWNTHSDSLVASNGILHDEILAVIK